MAATATTPFTQDEVEKARRRHVRQEFYRGEATPNRSNHYTGSVHICAACHRPWPCDAARLVVTVDAAQSDELGRLT